MPTNNKVDSSSTIDITPDPKVLIALSHTAIKPLDALCELIDNSIDSFSSAKLQGLRIVQPTIWIDLPKNSDIDKGIGILRIRDCGPGMTLEQAEHALKAGYSGNNSYDSLGLFGMGFNISTSKFGRITRFTTARKNDDFCTTTTIDLEKINESKSYSIEALQTKKDQSLEQGTIIEIYNWWPEGNPNHGFIKKITSAENVRNELGRIYATILRSKEICIMVNGKPCIAFEHCYWGSERYVERNGKKIFAYQSVDILDRVRKRCNLCRAIVPDNISECPECGSTQLRSVEERIRGWVGIQRFDDATKFGIDLIRNGRCIRVAEKNAFFEYTEDRTNTIKDYPIDGPYGRIIGEINLDHVPVDFLKQDFIRTSQEWENAISKLRGNSSLQPTKPGADSNDSVIFKLYQGYRKVRIPGTTDMYMGYWDPNENKPKRISREKEKEYYEKFKRKEDGYYDDSEWWKLVEEASKPPVEPLSMCPECGSQILKDTEVCPLCGRIIIGKQCINEECKETISKSATICSHCGMSQVPIVITPWKCLVCDTMNPPEQEICKKCGKTRGSINTLDKEYLLSISNKNDALSIKKLSITLSNGEESENIELSTYIVKEPMVVYNTNEKLPARSFKDSKGITVFVDPSHPVIQNCSFSIEEIISSEVASFICDLNRELSSNPDHSISNISWLIINKYWYESIEINSKIVKEKCDDLISIITNKISENISESDSISLYGEMSSDQQSVLANNLIKLGMLDKLNYLKNSGKYLCYVPPDFLLNVYDAYPKYFFNGGVWSGDYGVENVNLNPDVTKMMDKQLFYEYRNNIETLVLYSMYPSENKFTIQKVNITLKYLESNIED